MIEADLNKYYSSDQTLDKEALRRDAYSSLTHFQDVALAAFNNPGIRQTLVNAYKGLDRGQRDEVRGRIATVAAFARYATDWNQELGTPEAYEKQVRIKAKKYADERGAAEARADQLRNYYNGLLDKADQTVAVKNVFTGLTEGIESLRPISLKDKEVAAYTLAGEIRTYGGMIHSKEGRKELVEKGILSEQKIAAILRSNLVTGAEDNTPLYNKAGFGNDEAWDKAVLETAAGLLEAEWLNKLTALTNVNLDKKILETAQEVYEKRTAPKTVEVAPETVEGVSGEADVAPIAPSEEESGVGGSGSESVAGTLDGGLAREDGLEDRDEEADDRVKSGSTDSEGSSNLGGSANGEENNGEEEDGEGHQRENQGADHPEGEDTGGEKVGKGDLGEGGSEGGAEGTGEKAGDSEGRDDNSDEEGKAEGEENNGQEEGQEEKEDDSEGAGHPEGADERKQEDAPAVIPARRPSLRSRFSSFLRNNIGGGIKKGLVFVKNAAVNIFRRVTRRKPRPVTSA